jgi:hypothetical protein
MSRREGLGYPSRRMGVGLRTVEPGDLAGDPLELLLREFFGITPRPVNDPAPNTQCQPRTRPACSIHLPIMGACASSRVFTFT